MNSRLDQLNALLTRVWKGNAFYRAKWTQAGLSELPLRTLDDLARYPLTTRAELAADQLTHPPLGTNLTCPRSDLKSILHSSGTTAQPICWADTSDTWSWVTRQSRALLEISGVLPSDRVAIALGFTTSSGPRIVRAGVQNLQAECHLLQPQSPAHFWDLFARCQPTVLLAKPTALLTWLGAAPDFRTRPTASPHKVLLAGPPSGLSEEIRQPIQAFWKCACFDRYGMTEAGSVAAECTAHSGGLHLLDQAFVAECVDPDTGRPIADTDAGELVLTTLGRWACPIVRYRTGDAVRLVRHFVCPCGRPGTFLLGGVRRLEPATVPSPATAVS